MGDMVPVDQPIIEGALISFDQFVEPRDFDHYLIFLDTKTPPTAIYEDVATGPHGHGRAIRKVTPLGLTVGQLYYVQIMPFDTFGPGIPTAIASFTAGGVTAASIDSTPPAMPSGLVLTTGTQVSADGTIVCWVQATWAPNTEADLATYQVHFRVAPSTVPTTFTVDGSRTSVRLESVPGNVTVFARMLAYDNFQNASPFTAETSITTAADTTPPAPPSNLTPVSISQAIALLWTPPPDLDYAHSLVYANQTNNWGSSSIIGTGHSDFIHEGLGPSDTWFYWLKSVDTSGNVSVQTHPLSPTGGVGQTSSLLGTNFIRDLTVFKLLAGTLQVLVQVGVGGQNVFLDGVNRQIYITDDAGTTRVRFGKLGALTTQYGLQLFNEAGLPMWDFSTGALPAGITDQAVNADKLAVGALRAHHLQANIAYITQQAHIADAVIIDAHIV